ncbi:7012_t:CDS:2 [Gigaspora margarita]|uniref:7012_t:CDS:1 n=1 Tax=Gigaspora margarita TaxID=4874 RepID=A0ABN7VM92_GIGMA|nr:7012_t:CDS:2 [Gigaspora margarita]
MAFLPLVADVWYFIMYTPKGIYLSERYLIDITLNDDTKLRKELKNVMKIIVGLLKDRVEADDSFANKETEFPSLGLKQDKKDIEARFAKLEQSDKEKTDLITKLECDVSLIKQASVTSQSLISPPQSLDLGIYPLNYDQNSESTMLNNFNKLNTGDFIEFKHEELKQQLSTPIPTPITTDRFRDQDSSSVTAESIVYAFYKAIQSGQEGRLYWYYFIEKYDKKLDKIVISGVKRKTATSMSNVEIDTSAKSLNSNSSDSKTLLEIKVSKSSTSQTSDSSNLDTSPKKLPDVKVSVLPISQPKKVTPCDTRLA